MNTASLVWLGIFAVLGTVQYLGMKRVWKFRPLTHTVTALVKKSWTFRIALLLFLLWLILHWLLEPLNIIQVPYI